MVISVQESNVQAQPATAPRATVIIPAYNAEATLAKAIRSAQTQTERNIEIIVIDDCSPDGTFAVAQSFEKQDSRVHAFRLPENRGKSCAMNFARAKAKGEWIAFLDSDDWYAPTRLERLINAAEKHGVDMAGGNHVLVDIKAILYVGVALPCQNKETIIGVDEFLKGSNSTATFDYGMLLPIFRTSFIRAHKLDYYEPARFGEDFYVLLDYFMAGGKGVIVDDPLYYYTVPFGTISRQWAHERRSRYNYELSQNIHRHFTEKHDAQMTPLQRRLMERRGRGIDAMISFHQVRENLNARKYSEAILCLFKAPFQFWKTVARRTLKRIFEKLIPTNRYASLMENIEKGPHEPTTALALGKERGVNFSAQPKESPRVTIIIPAYKCESTLAKAVRSALNQTEQSLEIIIVDDCSPDGTFAVAQALEKMNPCIRVYQLPENHGKPFVMNFATEKARGKWIAVLDADDWYAPTRVKRLIDAAENAGVDMAGSNQTHVDIKARLCVGTSFPYKATDRIIDLDGFLQESNPTGGYDFGMLQPIFRASFIRENHVDYYIPALFGEGFYILLRFFASGGKGIVIDEPLYYYVQPFGVVSRQWAQEGGVRYKYELQKEIHQHFIEEYSPYFTAKQMRLMQRRARGIRAMIAFHHIRENLATHNFINVLYCLLTAPFQFWKTVARRFAKRITRWILPAPNYLPLLE